MIRAYGILNDRIEPDDAFLYGIPYPGVYVPDEAGRVVAKFFHDTYKKRDSPENLLEAALGRLELSEDTPRTAGGDEKIRITAAIHGGKGTIRQGMLRKLVVRFELAEGLHLYDEPVPAGMVATTVSVTGPPGLVFEEPILPPTRSLRLPNLDVELSVWSGNFDIVVPFYASGELASAVRPLEPESATGEVSVRVQACNDRECLLPRTETLSLEVPLDVVDVPALGIHKGHGQREGNYSTMPHMRRLILRSLRRRPLGILRFVLKNRRLERAARRRRDSRQTSAAP